MSSGTDGPGVSGAGASDELARLPLLQGVVPIQIVDGLKSL
jgi:hypothetical protein